MDFSKFMDNVMDKYPGFYSRVLEEFIGTNYDSVDYVARTENLYEDACVIMDNIGLEYNKEEVLKSPTYKRVNPDINWSDSQKNRILKLERKILYKFY